MGASTGATLRRTCDQTGPIRNLTESGYAGRTNLHQDMRNDPTTTTRTSSIALPGPSRRQAQRYSEIPPPKYDDLFPPARAPASTPLAKARPSPPKGMDPLVAAMWHNENLSLLHTLPDRLLFKIIEMLSNDGIECIRRVSRRFPPLCVLEVLSASRGGNPRLSETGPFNWPRFGTSSYLRPQFLELIDRDGLCHGCQSAQKSRRWEQRLGQLTEYIHCSACGADHPRCLFSATQRLKPARLRFCIAHEGHMRICDHDDGIVQLARLSNFEIKESWYKRKVRNTVLRCRDASHDKPCRKIPGGSFPKSKRDCGSSEGLCNGVRWPAVRACEQCPETFVIYWTAHISFDGQMDTLRSQMAELSENAGKYIVPRPANALETPGLRCFDPNDCHCITYSGTENVRWEWECGPWLPGKTKCLSDPFAGLNTFQPAKPSGSIISEVAHRWVRALKSGTASECPAEWKTHRSRDESPPLTYSPGRNFVDVRPCHTGKDCLAIDYVRTIRVTQGGKVCPQWYNTLDPTSYNITDDQDGLGVLWCPQPHCRNYFKGLPNYAGILRRREFRKECRHHDCQ